MNMVNKRNQGKGLKGKFLWEGDTGAETRRTWRNELHGHWGKEGISTLFEN